MQAKVVLQQAARYNGKISDQNRNTWQHIKISPQVIY